MIPMSKFAGNLALGGLKLSQNPLGKVYKVLVKCADRSAIAIF